MHLSQTAGPRRRALCWGLGGIYALWPGNKAKVDHAARSPLEDGDDNG